MHTAHPDLRFTIDDLVAEADRVTIRWTLRGTNTGPLLGRPPSGEPVELVGDRDLPDRRRQARGALGRLDAKSPVAVIPAAVAGKPGDRRAAAALDSVACRPATFRWNPRGRSRPT